MSALAFYKRLRDAGVDEATAMLCAEQFDVEVKLALDGILEPRRAKDRARKANKAPRNSAESTETPETAETLSRPLSPQTPLTPTHTHECVTTRARGASFAKPNGFARWWEAYPNKVGKRAAETAYAHALKRVTGPDPPAELMAGVERAKASRKWREGIIPNPATWLNQDRWEDQPTEQQPAPRAPHERPNADAKLHAKQANYERAWNGSERAAGFDGKP